MISFRWILPFLLLGACGGSSQNTPQNSQSAPASDKQGDRIALRDDAETEVYKNVTGQIRVAIVPVIHHGKNAFLLSISGVDSTIADHNLIHTRKANHQEVFFSTMLDGRERIVFAKEVRSDETDWKLKLPGTRIHHTLTYDSENSVSFDSQSVVEKYQKDFMSGKIQAIATFNRAAQQELEEQDILPYIKKMQKECGSTVGASVRWEDINDERLMKYSVAAYCKTGLRTLRDMCAWSPEAKQEIQNTGPFVCRIENTPGVKAGYQITQNGLEYRPFNTNAVDAAEMDARRLFDEEEVMLRHQDQLILIGKGTRNNPDSRPLYAGTAATGLTRQTTTLSQRYKFLPWAADRRSELRRDLDTKLWTLKCGETTVPLQKVDHATKNQLLKSLELREVVWRREPYLLARDNKGIYYYVDKLKEEYGGRHFQVFIGRRGQQKLSKLTGVVNDSKGTMFSTPSGDLRLVVDTSGRKVATWIRGKQAPKKLTMIDPNKNQVLIYDELGAYLEQKYGHICEF